MLLNANKARVNFCKLIEKIIINTSKDFFAKNNPTGYKTLHKGSSRDGALYSIGNLQTEKGIYRAYFYMKKKGEDYFIHEFSLNSEERDE